MMRKTSSAKANNIIKPERESGTFSSDLVKMISQARGEEGIDPSGKEHDTNPFGWVDIITFCESQLYLGHTLHPWQRIIMKIFYMGTRGNRHLKIIDDPEQRCMNCAWSGNSLRDSSPCLRCSLYPEELREKALSHIEETFLLDVEELEELRNCERDSKFQNEMDLIKTDLIDDSDARGGGSVREQVISKIGKTFNHLILVLGRRSGKSLLTAFICLYESYKLIEMGDPHAYFNMSPGDPIVVLNVATSEDVAKDSVFDKIKGMVLNSPYLKTKFVPGSLQKRSVRFYTHADLEKNADLEAQGMGASVEGGIYLLSGTSNSDTQVGKGVIVVVIDEMASMVSKDGSKMSDKELYEKLRHSVWQFRRDFKIICISNPLTTDGQFYELYEESFFNDEYLMFQLPTYKANPGISKSELEKDKLSSLRKGGITDYIMHIEARFMGGAANPLIPAATIDEAFERGERFRRAEHGNPSLLYYMHVDPAYSSDNYALAIVHVEEDPFRRSDYGENERIVYVDHVQIWSPDKATGTPVDISTCDTYIADCSRKFRLASITYDQWSSSGSVQFLQKMGLPARQTVFNSKYIQDIYSTLLDLFLQGRIVIYKQGLFALETMEQLKFLQQRFNKRTFSIAAAEGHHDDIPSCIAGASFVALNSRESYKGLPKIRTARINW